MAILKIARMGNPVLLGQASPVLDPTAPEMRRLVADMAETLADAGGIGLAAPQVHQPLRLFLWRDGPALRILFNPQVEPLGAETAAGWEGCLSIPACAAGWTAPPASAGAAWTSTASRPKARPRGWQPASSSTRMTTSTGSSTSCA
jgi:peptide deformylase